VPKNNQGVADDGRPQGCRQTDNTELNENGGRRIVVADPITEKKDAKYHEKIMKSSLGKSTGRSADGWSYDIGVEIDLWILREFQAWALSKKATFRADSVIAVEYWEDNFRVLYNVRFSYTGAVDPDMDEHAEINIAVRSSCGLRTAPTQLVLELAIVLEKGPKTVYNSFGMVLKSKDNKKVKIAGNGSPHCGR
jgi:hypothetical protein